METGIKLAIQLVCLTMIGMTSAAPTATTNTSSVPREWSQFCWSGLISDMTPISIECNVASGDFWDFHDYRNWTKGLESNTLVSLDVTCAEGGRVCLPWPFRAHNLDTLIIRNCINSCYYGDYNRTDVFEIPDRLRVYESYGVTTEVDFMSILGIPIQSVHPAIDCGPMKAERIISQRSKTHFIEPDVDLDDDEVTDVFSGSVRDMNDLSHTCRYENLQEYDISQNGDDSVTRLFADLINSRFPKLRIFNISRTGRTVVPSLLTSWRRTFPNLEILDLSHNHISRFDFQDMSLSDQSVGLIDLRHNNLTNIGKGEIRSIVALKGAFIDIRENPFVCSCAMSNFSKFLRDFKSAQGAEINRNYSYLWNLACASPRRFEGMRIADLSHDVLCSSDVTVYHAQIAVLSIVVVVLLLVVFLLARYRKEVRILAFTRLHIVLPCQPVESFGTKVYDAFVSYSHLDYQWVVKTLLPRLENGDSSNGVSGHFRLCLHQRDFAVGAAIADNIVESVEASRHTILVLSRNFLKSEWCLMEFRTAFHQSLIEKKKHLILVLLEDIPKEELDSDLKRCLKTWTYINVNDKLFWDRIVYSLTDKNTIKGKSRRSEPSNDMTPSPSSDTVLWDQSKGRGSSSSETNDAFHHNEQPFAQF